MWTSGLAGGFPADDDEFVVREQSPGPTRKRKRERAIRHQSQPLGDPVQTWKVHELNMGRIALESGLLRRDQDQLAASPQQRRVLLQQRDDLSFGHVLGDVREQDRVEPRRAGCIHSSGEIPPA